jgi:hypothetical protein
MGEEEKIEEIVEKPQSMLSPRVKQALVEFINEESKRATEQGDTALLMDLQNAKKLILNGCWSVRRSNPYLVFMGECVSSSAKEAKTLEETQRAFKECAEKWKCLKPEDKAKYSVLAGELAVYDYL